MEGIFRLNGSAKRIKDLQAIFDTPDRYGKGLDWTGYTVHDAANILRRYLNQLPQPIVPLEYYEQFRDPLRSHQAQAVGDTEAASNGNTDAGDFDHAAAIATYQRLITEIPPLNRQLLLYILDLLAVFSSKSEQNRMDSANLAAIFQPGMLSHPTHDMSPSEYRLSQDVIVFLIENQDNFLIGMNGTAADEKTVQEVQNGAQPRQPSSPMPKSSAIGRSASNASAGADSLRKFGIRRNVSVSSKNSRSSQNMPSPHSPPPGSPHASITGSGVHRSNTLPSKRSPGISSASRFQNPLDSPTASIAKPASPGYLSAGRTASPSSRLASGSLEKPHTSGQTSVTPIAGQSPQLLPVAEAPSQEQSRDRPADSEKLSLQPPSPALVGQSSLSTPKAERKASGLFSKSPTSDGERSSLRQPNKLRKKRPESSSMSAHSSTQSLHATSQQQSPTEQAFYTPLPTPGAGAQTVADPMASVPPTPSNTAAPPSSEIPTPMNESTHRGNNDPGAKIEAQPSSGKKLRPGKSPAGSLHSRSSMTDLSEADHLDVAEKGGEKKKRSWRSSFSAKKNGEGRLVASSPPEVNPIAEKSTSSITSAGKPGKSMTNDTQVTGMSYTTVTESSDPSNVQSSSNESTPSKEREAGKEKGPTHEMTEKKGPIGWFKAKVAQAKEERREREAGKERAKSPPRNDSGTTSSKQSLSAIAQDRNPSRGRSVGPNRAEGVALEANAVKPSAAGGS